MSRLNTIINEEHLYVISDLHLGNPSFVKGDSLNLFLKYLSKRDASLCINGDGIDLLQLSVPKLTSDLHSISNTLLNFCNQGNKKIYYIIGNHDVYMEAFLEDSGIFSVVPFLDVVSGDQHIHIEHGHLYDPIFLFYPKLHIQMARLLGLFVLISPVFFQLWFKIENFFTWLRHKKSLEFPDPPIDNPSYISAARELFDRGFDTVIFGHTHHSGMQAIGKNKIYANAGSWTNESMHYIRINNGNVQLMEWRDL